MTRILDALKGENFKCVATAAPETLLQEENDVDDSPAQVQYRPFETPRPKGRYLPVDTLEVNSQSLFKFFVDGSERLTKVADIIDPNSNYYPLYVAQTSVATTKLVNATVRIEDFQMENTLMLPDTFDSMDIKRIGEIVQGADSNSKRKLCLKIDTYAVGDGDKPSDQARKAVLKRMHEEEIRVIESLAISGKVTRENMLVIDGALEFYEKFQSESFRNVAGVSKRFDMNKSIGTGNSRIQAGVLVAKLPDKHRTPAIGLSHRNLHIGTWYLRIRDAKYLRVPQDGVVKIEIFPDKPADSRQKLEGGRCDIISSHVLALRDASTPLTDRRWASHLYPVYITEQFAKAQFHNSEVLSAFF